jgi:peptidoglycan/LPS O-acetylase OafA/YrhL
VDKTAVVLYPYFVWSILQGLLQIALSHYANRAVSAVDLLKIAYVPIGQFYFLYTLFVIMMIYRLFYRRSASDVVFVSVTIVCFIIERSGFNLIQWNVAHDVAYFLIYFGVGVAAAQTSILARAPEWRSGWLLAILIGGYAAIVIGVTAHWEQEPIVQPMLVMSGIAATVALAILIGRSSKLPFVKLWGTRSLEIYVAHVIAAAAMRIALQRILGFNLPVAQIVLCTAVGIYGPILLAYLSQQLVGPYAFTLSRTRVSLGKGVGPEPFYATPSGQNLNTVHAFTVGGDGERGRRWARARKLGHSD